LYFYVLFCSFLSFGKAAKEERKNPETIEKSRVSGLFSFGTP